MESTSLYISNYSTYHDLVYQQVYLDEEENACFKMVSGGFAVFYDFILYLENVLLFSRRTADELLSVQCAAKIDSFIAIIVIS